jgi:transporter family-2 protein
VRRLDRWFGLTGAPLSGKEQEKHVKLPLYIFTMFLGVVLAVHLAMNGKVGSVMNNARVANALFWCIGALGAVAIGLTGWESGALSPLKQVHPVLLLAGILGASLVFAIAWLIPQVGAGSVMITLLAGQVVGGLLMSHFGWLGSPVQPITTLKVVGVLVMIGGVALATYGQ